MTPRSKNNSNKKTSPTKNDSHIIIIGLGPVGLAAAIEACRKDIGGRKVIVFTNRQSYTRNQVFRIDKDVFAYLKELVDENMIQELLNDKEIKTLSTPKAHYFLMKIKTLENLLYHKLLQYDKIIIKLTEDEKNSIKQIDSEKRVVKLNDGTSYHFKYLIAADGARHKIANQLKAQGLKIEYTNTQHDQMHNIHSTANFQLPAGKANYYQHKLFKNKIQAKSCLKKLTPMGWDFYSVPEVRMFIVNDTLYVGSECPEQLKNEPAEIEKWSREVLTAYLSTKNINNLKLINTNNECSKFQIQMEESSCTVAPFFLKKRHMNHIWKFSNILQQISYFFILGDALRGPHYHTGSGVVIGLRETKAFGEFLDSEQSFIDLENYHSKVASIRDINRENIDKYLDGRALREQEAEAGNINIKPHVFGSFS